MTKKLQTTNLETNEAYQKALYWFFSYPLREIGLSKLAENIKVSKSTANKVVSRLIKEGFLLKEEIGRVWRLKCNQKHQYNQTLKIGYNLSIISSAGITELVREKIGNTKAIILFGSYRKGDDTETSDIDIAAEIFRESDLKIYELGVIPEFGYRKNVKVTLHVFFRNKIDLNLFANIANGIVLDGFLEAKP